MARPTAIRKAIARKLGKSLPEIDDKSVQAEFFAICEKLSNSARGLKPADAPLILELATLGIQIARINDDILKRGDLIESSTKHGTTRKAHPGRRVLPGLRARAGALERSLGLESVTANFGVGVGIGRPTKEGADSGGVQEELDKYFDGGTPHKDVLAHAEWYGPDEATGAHYWRAEPGWRWLPEEQRWIEDAATADRKPAKPLPLRCTAHGYFAFALGECPSVGCAAAVVDEFSFARRSA